MIAELLGKGRESARSGRELSAVLNCRARDVSAQVEKERREGFPICAATSAPYGYYLARDGKELEEYLKSLKGRAVEIFKTRQALVKVLQKIQEGKEAEHG